MAEAKPLLVEAVKNMSVQDAKGILTGGDTAATDYFRRTTAEPLGQKRFLPIVKKATERWDSPSNTIRSPAEARNWAWSKEDQATIEQYVTQKSLDGLYL